MKNEELINLQGGYTGEYKCILFDEETGECAWALPHQPSYNRPACDESNCVPLD